MRGTTAFSRKRFGQHFLEPAWVHKVIHAIDPRPDEVFVEIGPGRGALTRPLAARAKRVVAFEIDRDLASALRTDAPPNTTVAEGDFLQAPASGLPPVDAIRVAGNLPYNVASPILFKLVEWYAAGAPLVDATLMLQREVAERLAAAPGTRDYGVLTVLIRHSATVRRLLVLPPGAFRPAPRVHSALVQLRFHPLEPGVRDPGVFAAVVQAVFTRRRKTLANALLAYQGTCPPDRYRHGGQVAVPAAGISVQVALERAGIDGRRRPETLTIAEFARLSDAYVAGFSGSDPGRILV